MMALSRKLGSIRSPGCGSVRGARTQREHHTATNLSALWSTCTPVRSGWPKRLANTDFDLQLPVVNPEFKDNAVRLGLLVQAYNLGNFLRRLVLPTEMARWRLTSLRERLMKVGARLICHASCQACQRKQRPQTLTTGGDTCRFRLPRPDVQASEAHIAKCRYECLTVQPTTRVPSLIWGIPAGDATEAG